MFPWEPSSNGRFPTIPKDGQKENGWSATARAFPLQTTPNCTLSQAVQSLTTEDSSFVVQEERLPHWESFKRMRAAISQVRSLEEMTPVFLGDWSI